MAAPLPVFDTPPFPVTIPSTQKTLMIRPFLVREEKVLLMAEEGDAKGAVEAVAQVIRNCSNGVIEPKSTPYFDIEYLLLQLRARSVGEIITPVYRCHHTIESTQEPCGHATPITINLNEISVQNLTRSPEQFKIDLPNGFVLRLRYPSIYTIGAMTKGGNTTTTEFLMGLCDLFEFLEDTKTGTGYRFEEYTDDEKMSFLESLSPTIYQQLLKFVEDMPTVSHQFTYTCEQCKFTHTIRLLGVSDFLV